MLDKKAVESECGRCRSVVWLFQYCGFKLEADVTPIDLRVEVDCFLKRRYTFGLVRWLPSFYLEKRSMRNIARQYEFILARHECWSVQSAAVFPSYWATTTTNEVTF